MSELRRGPARDERGFAMVLAISLVVVMSMLGAVVLFNGEHADRSSERGANWNEALHVAEAGVEDALAAIAEGQTAPGVLTGSVTDGEYEATITALGRHRYRIDSLGTVAEVAGLRTQRRLEVVVGPPSSFGFALFSLTNVTTKNNNHIEGDVWANGSVVVHNNDSVDGSVFAATGWVQLRNNSLVTGDVHTGGQNQSGVAISLANGARIDGAATASSTAPGCSDDPGHAGYRVEVSGSIGGLVTTWGDKFGSGPVGGVDSHTCTPAPATQALPDFTWNPANYDPPPLVFSSPTEFNTYFSGGARQNVSGTYYVEGSGSLNLTGMTIGGDTTIVATSASIDANGVGAANDSDKLLVLVSYYQPPSGTACTNQGGNPVDCAIGMKNNFQPGDNTGTLLYAPNGPVAFKNNADFLGVVYGADIVVKNNMDISYDPRLDQVVGFGPVTVTPEYWHEVGV